MTNRVVVYVAIGANLPHPDGRDALATCIDARQTLDALAGWRRRVASRWYASAPEPPSGQPDYVNGVVAYEVRSGAESDPAAILFRLQQIERAFGRVRSVPNAARTLDLDIVAIDALTRTAPDPIVPHPRAHLRGFVLAPLAEIAPDWCHPIVGRTARELLEALPRAALPRRLDG